MLCCRGSGPSSGGPATPARACQTPKSQALITINRALIALGIQLPFFDPAPSPYTN